MNKEQQNLSWSCLPKEVRNHIRSDYEYYLKRYEAVNANTAKGAIDALEDLFGHHNLTSDTEPEEMLYAKRSKVCHLYECYKPYQRTSNEVVKDILEVAFGDKCQPDKENTPKSGELKSDQAEPKFRKGDKVKTNHQLYLNSDIVPIGSILSVKDYEYFGNAGFVYTFKESEIKINEDWLEPYTEPETKDNMEKNSMEISKLF